MIVLAGLLGAIVGGGAVLGFGGTALATTIDEGWAFLIAGVFGIVTSIAILRWSWRRARRRLRFAAAFYHDHVVIGEGGRAQTLMYPDIERVRLIAEGGGIEQARLEFRTIEGDSVSVLVLLRNSDELRYYVELIATLLPNALFIPPSNLPLVNIRSTKPHLNRQHGAQWYTQHHIRKLLLSFAVGIWASIIAYGTIAEMTRGQGQRVGLLIFSLAFLAVAILLAVHSVHHIIQARRLLSRPIPPMPSDHALTPEPLDETTEAPGDERAFP